MFPYEKLLVWQRAHALALEIRRVSSTWDDVALRAQVSRAALSVVSNIVEGAGSPSPAMFARFLGIALASAGEVEYQLRFAHESGLLPVTSVTSLREEVLSLKRMLVVLHRRIHATAQQKKGIGRKGADRSPKSS